VLAHVKEVLDAVPARVDLDAFPAIFQSPQAAEGGVTVAELVAGDWLFLADVDCQHGFNHSGEDRDVLDAADREADVAGVAALVAFQDLAEAAGHVVIWHGGTLAGR
jgi:hypothetical protein